MAKTNFVQGTRVFAAFVNKIFSHRHDGLDQDGSGPVDYAADTGAADAYVIALSSALTGHIAGMPIRFKAANANTGASTININGLGAVAIKKNVSEALAAGDIAGGQVIEVVYDGTYYQLHPSPDPGTGELSGESAGASLSTSPQTIGTLDLGSVLAGERYVVFSGFTLTSVHGSGQHITIAMSKDSGTADMEFVHNSSSIEKTYTNSGTMAGLCSLCGIIKVKTSGTLVIKMTGVTSAGNATAGAVEIMTKK